jgi:hypothetical protein
MRWMSREERRGDEGEQASVHLEISICQAFGA